jgi:hypothetical protein
MSVFNKLHPVRVAAVSFLLFAVAIYLIEIIRGKIPNDRRLGTPELSIVIFVSACSFFLLRPEVIARLSHLELSGLKIDLLEKVQQRQEEQGRELESIRLIMPLLLPETERAHLRNLASGYSGEYTASNVLRTELRRLGYISLIARRENRSISELEDGLKFQLADYVSLTKLGQDWVSRLSELDKSTMEASSG